MKRSPMRVNFAKLTEEAWVDHGSPFEVESVMTYCSGCSSNGRGPVLVIKQTGGEFANAPRMTTEDALQVQYRYCRKMEGFEFKKNVKCTSKDAAGTRRNVFTDRICDGMMDCNGMEDELGGLGECLHAQPKTANGCCGKINFQGTECVRDGTFEERMRSHC